MERALEEKARAFPNRRGATLGLRVFSRKGREGSGGVRWFELEDLYG